MTDQHFDPTAADGELLSAYLAGELDAAETAELEHRLASEPKLAAQLDTLADVLVALGGYDTVDEPAGFAQRLDERLAAASAPADLAAHRRRRAASTQWLRIGSVAAVIALGAVMAGTMVRSGGGGTVAMDSAMDEGATSEAAAALSDPGTSRPAAPVILDDNVAVAGKEALRLRYSDVPEAQGLLGVPRDEAAELAVAFTEAVSNRGERSAVQESAVTSGSDAKTAGDAGTGGGAGDETESAGDGEADAAAAPPAPDPDAARDLESRRRAVRAAAGDRCLAAIIREADAAPVPVRVETVRYDGEPAVVYVLVTATPRSAELDRMEVWVVRPDDCTVIVFQQY